MALTFPSVEWFEALAAAATTDERFRHFGRVDAIVALKVGPHIYSLTFDVLTCRDVREISEGEMRDADFVIEMSPDAWRAMIEDIHANGRATRDHTLNSLDISLDEPIHRNPVDDGYRADKFFRFNPSLQAFFDNAAKLDTVFNLPAAQPAR